MLWLVSIIRPMEVPVSPPSPLRWRQGWDVGRDPVLVLSRKTPSPEARDRMGCGAGVGGWGFREVGDRF